MVLVSLASWKKKKLARANHIWWVSLTVQALNIKCCQTRTCAFFQMVHLSLKTFRWLHQNNTHRKNKKLCTKGMMSRKSSSHPTSLSSWSCELLMYLGWFCCHAVIPPDECFLCWSTFCPILAMTRALGSYGGDTRLSTPPDSHKH